MIKEIVTLIAFGLIGIGIVLQIVVSILSRKKSMNEIEPYLDQGRYAVLIPARNESQVIEGLLKSIMKQTRKLNPEDVYIIVESKLDPTNQIAKKYHMNIVVRKNLENRRRKGYALDDALQVIKKKYDAYFIFDADNVLDQNYIKEMSRTIKEGYDIGIGYRNCKNGNDSVVASSSALTFSMINTLINRIKNKKQKTNIISGTGYYIRGDLLEQFHGFPCHSLTEDYELTLLATLNGYTTYYNEQAIFYDEQPRKYSVSIRQRTRWIKGYFEARRKYIRKIRKSISKQDKNYGSKIEEVSGVTPIILMLFGSLLFLITQFLFQSQISKIMINILLFLFVIYIVLWLFTFLFLYLERGKISISFANQVKTLFFHPIFLLGYVRCFLLSIIKKDLAWEAIEHQVSSLREDIK